MFELSNLFSLLKTKDDIGTKDMVAGLLSTSPEALRAFEEKYAEAIIDKARHIWRKSSRGLRTNWFLKQQGSVS